MKNKILNTLTTLKAVQGTVNEMEAVKNHDEFRVLANKLHEIGSESDVIFLEEDYCLALNTNLGATSIYCSFNESYMQSKIHIAFKFNGYCLSDSRFVTLENSCLIVVDGRLYQAEEALSILSNEFNWEDAQQKEMDHIVRLIAEEDCELIDEMLLQNPTQRDVHEAIYQHAKMLISNADNQQSVDCGIKMLQKVAILGDVNAIGYFDLHGEDPVRF
jgi:hypothetical protein